MQIQYCDDCGTRVDETELTAIAGKIYCKTCAKNHAPQPKAVGTGVYSNPRPSTRVTRLTKTPTPGRGGAKLGGSFNPEIPSAAESDYQEEYVEPAPPPSSGLGAWAKRNTALAISLVAGLVGVLLIVLWSVFSGPPKNNTAVAPPPNQLPSPASVKTTTDKKNTVATVTTKPTPAVVAPPVAVDDDPRTDKAMRDLAQIKELIAGNKANPFDIRKRLENLVEPFWIKKTPMGIEGEKLLAQFKNEKRPPDKADGAQPGLQARLGFDKAEELFNTDFKVADVKTVANVNIPSADALKAAFGRDADIAVKFIGFVEVPKDGQYTFYVTSDDGSMMYIGDYKLVDNGGTHAATERDGSIDLKAGKHALRLDYYNGKGAAACMLSWSGPGLIKEIVPPSALSSIPKK
ncbi:MAG TPA: PA14 domain-containing protein [Planctomycetota bacterium]|nr:PA14 domain-containing protein [Planctomycetota bacterium]